VARRVHRRPGIRPRVDGAAAARSSAAVKFPTPHAPIRFSRGPVSGMARLARELAIPPAAPWGRPEEGSMRHLCTLQRAASVVGLALVAATAEAGSVTSATGPSGSTAPTSRSRPASPSP
jgi:hypothetical protein